MVFAGTAARYSVVGVAAAFLRMTRYVRRVTILYT
jgi:hypothetical protein